MYTIPLPSFDELDKVFVLNSETGELTRRNSEKTKGLLRKTSISGKYRKVRVNGKQHAEHRIIFVLANKQPVPAGYEVDHINLNKLDNRPKNLRLVTRAQNMANTKKNCTNTSGFKGVSYCRNKGKFRAQIGVNNVCRKLGYFNTAAEAAAVHDRAAIALRGEFALTNAMLGLLPLAPAPAAPVSAPAVQAPALHPASASRCYPGVPDMPAPIQRCAPAWSRPATHRAVPVPY